jgi:hypothetical protein
MIDVRRCADEDVGALMAFIDRHWQPGHVLATSRALVDWQHREPDGSYNFMLAWNGDALVGALGYVPTRRYDPALADDSVLWLALWRTRDDVKAAGLGLRLLEALSRSEPHTAMAVSGINLSHPPIYRALGYRVAELGQYFLVNPEMPRHLIAAADDAAPVWPEPTPGDAVFTEMDGEALRTLRLSGAAHPRKTACYFRTRFLEHPFYRYRVVLAAHGAQQALLAMRVARHGDASALRLVDSAGDVEVLARCGSALARQMREDRVEYADLWQWGLPEGTLEAAGFARVDPGGPIVVPNYFEPFLAKNGRILCAVKAADARPFRVFRADGDQDRPNRL